MPGSAISGIYRRGEMKEHSGIMKAVRYAGVLFAALVIGLTPLAASLPPVAIADTNPVDLELGGEGATYWSIAGIKPTDSGTKIVELHNAGTSDGFVTIWVSDIYNGEGLNPEPETGDTSEPGELGDYLLFDLTAENLTSNLNLPVTIGNLPQSAADSDYIEIMPVKAGETVELEWHWELPAGTGNIVQGDSLTFTINYMLQECVITDVSSVVTSTGNFTQDITVVSQNSKGKLFIKASTTGTVAGNKTLTDIWIVEIDKDPLPPPVSKKHVSNNYEAGPEGTTFDTPIIITLSYDPDKIPNGINEEDLFPAVWNKDSGQWAALDSFTVHPESNTITALISHFSRYSVMVPVPEPDTPTGGSGDTDETAGIITIPEEPETTGALLETDMLGNESTVEIGEDGTLGQTLTISDAEGYFTIDIAGGTRITGPDGILLSRIEMIRTERTVTVPDGIVILSPTYELTGYTADMEAVPVTFEPPVSLIISYDPKNLPENFF
jgi:hypothetical protein